MHEFDAGYRNRRVSKTEPQHRTQPKLDRSMVLFNQIIEVFDDRILVRSRVDVVARTHWPLDAKPDSHRA